MSLKSTQNPVKWATYTMSNPEIVMTERESCVDASKQYAQSDKATVGLLPHTTMYKTRTALHMHTAPELCSMLRLCAACHLLFTSRDAFITHLWAEIENQQIQAGVHWGGTAW